MLSSVIVSGSFGKLAITSVPHSVQNLLPAGNGFPQIRQNFTCGMLNSFEFESAIPVFITLVAVLVFGASISTQVSGFFIAPGSSCSESSSEFSSCSSSNARSFNRLAPSEIIMGVQIKYGPPVVLPLIPVKERSTRNTSMTRKLIPKHSLRYFFLDILFLYNSANNKGKHPYIMIVINKAPIKPSI